MWEIGDRVVVVEAPRWNFRQPLNISVGDKGTVIAHEGHEGSGIHLIRFDRDIGGHSGAMKGEKPLSKDGHCWWMHELEEEGILMSYNLLKCKRISKKRNNNFY